MIATPTFAAVLSQAQTTVATVAVAQPPPPQPNTDPGGKGEEFGSASPVGLLVLIVFLVAIAFLARSMSRHLKRVPASFEPGEGTGPGTGSESSGASSGKSGAPKNRADTEGDGEGSPKRGAGRAKEKQAQDTRRV